MSAVNAPIVAMEANGAGADLEMAGGTDLTATTATAERRGRNGPKTSEINVHGRQVHRVDNSWRGVGPEMGATLVQMKHHSPERYAWSKRPSSTATVQASALVPQASGSGVRGNGGFASTGEAGSDADVGNVNGNVNVNVNVNGNSEQGGQHGAALHILQRATGVGGASPSQPQQGEPQRDHQQHRRDQQPEQQQVLGGAAQQQQQQEPVQAAQQQVQAAHHHQQPQQRAEGHADNVRGRRPSRTSAQNASAKIAVQAQLGLDPRLDPIAYPAHD